MKKNYTLILSTVLVGAGAYLIYNRSRKQKEQEESTEAGIKAKQEAEEKAKAEAEAKRLAKEKENSLENPNSFASKVAKIQLYLGVTPDGKVGPNTLGALTKKFPKYTTISTSNVNAIISDIEANKKSAENLEANKTSTANLQEKKALAYKLADLTKGTVYYAELVNNIVAKQYQFDVLTGSYRYMNQTKAFNKGRTFGQGSLKDRGNGEILIAEGTFRYATDPSNFIIKKR
jgi:hypothetical protein